MLQLVSEQDRKGEIDDTDQVIDFSAVAGVATLDKMPDCLDQPICAVGPERDQLVIYTVPAVQLVATLPKISE